MSNSVTVRIEYTKGQQDRTFIETGKRVDRENRYLSIDDMTTEQRTDLLVIEWNAISRFANRNGSTIRHSRLSKRIGTSEPCVGYGDNIYFDHVPSDEELLKLMSELADEKRTLQAEVAELLPAWREAEALHKAEEEEQSKAKAIRDEECEERRAGEREEKSREAVIINWKNGTALFDLANGLSVASELGYDHRWRSWTKEITGINRSQKNGYMYEGSFVNEGTVELEQTERRVFLVASETGSNKYRAMYYQVVELVDGKLIKHDNLFDADETPGWALRMREGISELLEIGNEEKPPQIVISMELAQRIMVALSLNDQGLANELNLQIE